MSDAARQAAGAIGAEPGAGDDAALIARSLDMPECFGVLFDRHAPAIYRYIVRRLGPGAADDLVVETFLIAFRIAITPYGRTVFVTSNLANTVTPIRTASNTVLKPIKAGSAPQGIAIARIP